MTDQITEIPADATPTISVEALDGLILGVIGDTQPLAPDERRIRERFPIYCKMVLTPIGNNNNRLTDESSTIFGKDLSVSGICFSHESLISQSRVAISLTHPQIGQFHVEAEVVWTRRTPIGLYESGCRLIRKIPGHNISAKS
jgi:hypothetical protein